MILERLLEKPILINRGGQTGFYCVSLSVGLTTFWLEAIIMLNDHIIDIMHMYRAKSCRIVDLEK